MKAGNFFLVALALAVSACEATSPAPTPTLVPLAPAQYAESAFQWLETHALMKDKVDWVALRAETADMTNNAKTTVETYPAICRALREMKDGNGWFLVPGLEMPDFYSGYYTLFPENRVIIKIDPDSPAEEAGLRIGDVIDEVNGHPPIPSTDVVAFPPCNTKEIESSAEDGLLIRRAGGSIQITVEKTELTAGTEIYNPPLGQRFGSDPKRIGYIELTPEDGLHVEYVAAVQELMRRMDKKPVCGWMIDLRRNSGGDIWSYIAALGPILGEGDLGGFEYPDGTREAWAYRNGQVFWNDEYRGESEIDGPVYEPKRVTPVALLISPATQAAGELTLITFKGRADILSFGEPTRGLPTLVTHTDLSDGSRIFVSGANSFDRNGNIYSASIMPDVSVTTDWSRFGTQQDPVILAAMDWLQSQSACKP